MPIFSELEKTRVNQERASSDARFFVPTAGAIREFPASKNRPAIAGLPQKTVAPFSPCEIFSCGSPAVPGDDSSLCATLY
jgi:hypothetical protein